MTPEDFKLKVLTKVDSSNIHEVRNELGVVMICIHHIKENNNIEKYQNVLKESIKKINKLCKTHYHTKDINI